MQFRGQCSTPLAKSLIARPIALHYYGRGLYQELILSWEAMISQLPAPIFKLLRPPFCVKQS